MEDRRTELDSKVQTLKTEIASWFVSPFTVSERSLNYRALEGSDNKLPKYRSSTGLIDGS